MLKCSQEAFAKCPTAQYCGSRGDAVYMEGSACDSFNRVVELTSNLHLPADLIQSGTVTAEYAIALTKLASLTSPQFVADLIPAVMSFSESTQIPFLNIMDGIFDRLYDGASPTSILLYYTHHNAEILKRKYV